jgi:hypothetical protein
MKKELKIVIALAAVGTLAWYLSKKKKAPATDKTAVADKPCPEGQELTDVPCFAPPCQKVCAPKEETTGGIKPPKEETMPQFGRQVVVVDSEPTGGIKVTKDGMVVSGGFSDDTIHPKEIKKKGDSTIFKLDPYGMNDIGSSPYGSADTTITGGIKSSGSLLDVKHGEMGAYDMGYTTPPIVQPTFIESIFNSISKSFK